MKRTERRELTDVVAAFRTWSSTAVAVKGLAAHLPTSGSVSVSKPDHDLLNFFEQAAASDVGEAQRLAKVSFFDGRKKYETAHAAAARLTQAHQQASAAGWDTRLDALHTDYQARGDAERSALQAAMSKLDRLYRLSTISLADVNHFPVTRSSVLKGPEVTAMESIRQLFAAHSGAVASLVDGSACQSGTCAAGHSSAALLLAVSVEAAADNVPQTITRAAERVAAKMASERTALKALVQQVATWSARVPAIRQSREGAADAIRKRMAEMVAASVPLTMSSTSMVLVPVTAQGKKVLSDLMLIRDAPLTPEDQKTLDRATAMASTLPKVASGFTANWDCTRDAHCQAAHAAAARLTTEAPDLGAELDRLATVPKQRRGGLDDLLDPDLELARFLPKGFHSPGMIDGGTTERARMGVHSIANAAKVSKDAATSAKAAADAVRTSDVTATLREMDLETLRKASKETIRVTALQNAGLTNVWDILGARNELDFLPGLGEASARSIAQAVLRLHEGVRDETPVRIDVKVRSKLTLALLQGLQTWDAVRRFEPTKDEVALAQALNKLFRSKAMFTHVLTLVSGEGNQQGPDLKDMLDDALSRSAPSVAATDVWKDFLSRPADYFGMLTELGFITEDAAKMHGDLPEEIVEAVRAKELRRDYLTASLRTYQSFGARFALVQEKVVIGDEMGLGKTVEALAMVAHLRAVGQSHFLVVCPAAVVSNWMRETDKHTTLPAYRIHGPMYERKQALKSWLRNGGVGVTTYDLLTWASDQFDAAQVGAVIFDEAHYIKNPLAKRSVASQKLIDKIKHVILMTGTPLENTVQEFRNLIGYIRPELANSAPEYLASRFRKHVAPVYLRRNQEDVLTELPELVEIDDWLGMSDADERDYRAAVVEGNFMMMRRAAMLTKKSVKVERLVEIVEEAEANGRRVIVFSFFRDVLSDLADVLPGEVFGPLTGSTRAADRQDMVDKFSAAGDGAVLISQITAGGVGLNIQSASVVVICEPQLKPTSETQAIARAHRMGQTNTVQVHRLLSENSVDERIREILATKQHLFDEFARDSVIAKRAPDAVDVTDAEVSRLVIEAERERILGQAPG